MNPFDLPGPRFLLLYSFCAIAAIALTFLLRHLFRSPGGDYTGPPLDPFELALLQAGPRHAADTAIASLVHQRILSAETLTRRLALTGAPLPANPHPAEEAVYLTFKRATRALRADEVRSSVARAFRPLSDGLVERGLTRSPVTAPFRQLASALPFLLLFAFGGIKWLIGVSRDRPVLYLTLAILLALGGAVMIAARPIRVTRRGSSHLGSLRRSSAALRTSASRPSATLSPLDLATAIALFGLPVVAYGELAALDHTLRHQRRDDGGGNSCGSSGTAACSSSSSSCGSSGCGGCGSGS